MALVIFLTLMALFLFFGLFNFLFAWKFRPSPRLDPAPNPDPVVVIVPVRDDPAILDSLPYLKALDYPDYRILVVDDSQDPDFIETLRRHRDGTVEFIHRVRPEGRKAGALNFALDHLASNPPEYVVILDADHRPPPDFLARAVTLIEHTDAHCVCGYQKHDIGAHGFFGRFVRAGGATAMRGVKAQSDLGFGAFFAGAAAIFRYDWLREMRFDETSITEDWELTLRSYGQGEFRVVVREDLWVSAAVPWSLKWLIREQVRWTGGITRDFRKHVRRLLRSDLPAKTKVGLFWQGLMGLQGPTFLLFWLVLPWLLPVQAPLILTLGLLAFVGFSWAWPLYQGSRSEGYGRSQSAGVLAYGLALSYVMAPFGSYAFFSALVRSPTSWTVTRRRG